MFNINEIRSTVTGQGGLLFSSHFFVVIRAPKWALSGSDSQTSDTKNVLPFLCSSAELPGISVTTSNNRRQGIGIVEKRPTDISFNQINLSFMVDGRGLVFNFFQKWMQNINNLNTAMSPNNSYNQLKINEFGYPDDFETTVDLYHFNSAGDEILKYTLYNAFPASISNVAVDWDRTEILRLPVFLNYKYFTTEAFDYGSTAPYSSLSFLTAAELLYIDPRVAAAYTFSNIGFPTQIQNIINTVDNFAVPLLNFR